MTLIFIPSVSHRQKSSCYFSLLFFAQSNFQSSYATSVSSIDTYPSMAETRAATIGRDGNKELLPKSVRITCGANAHTHTHPHTRSKSERKRNRKKNRDESKKFIGY